jgi:glycosyltransferase involved in cell wall biosynthesis
MSFNKPKILFVIPSLETGGSERVLVTLIRNLDPKQFDLSLAILGRNGPFGNDLPPHVTSFDLKVQRVRYAAFSILRLVNDTRPDIVFSFGSHLNFLISAIKALFPKKTRLIIREGTMPREIGTLSRKSWFTTIYRLLYNRSDVVICQSDAMKKSLTQHYGVRVGKICQVYNPVDLRKIDHDAGSVSPFPPKDGSLNILAVGRLELVKRFDLLIREFSRFRTIHTQARLWILGDGSQMSILKQLSSDLGVGNVVNFMGLQSNPYAWMKHADLFVICSAYEGLPNVLLEAIACGCPVLATDSPGGIRDIMTLTHNQNRLVPSNKLEIRPDFFSRTDILKTKTLLLEHFGVENIVNKYEQIMRVMISSA